MSGEIELDLPDVRLERAGAWFCARATKPKLTGAIVVTGSCSKESFVDAERMLRVMLNPSPLHRPALRGMSPRNLSGANYGVGQDAGSLSR